MTSIGYGDIIPVTDIEKLISVFVMILGATTYASLFGTFVVIIDNLNGESRENKQKLTQAMYWAKLRNVSKVNRERISFFYTFVKK
jgi:hypothetical protein